MLVTIYYIVIIFIATQIISQLFYKVSRIYPVHTILYHSQWGVKADYIRRKNKRINTLAEKVFP